MAEEIEYRVSYDYTDYEDQYIGDDEDGNEMFETEQIDSSDYFYVFAENEEDARSKALSELRYLEDLHIWDIEPVE